MIDADGDMVRTENGYSGSKMVAAACEWIIESFFTTKRLGVATGMGLSASSCIATENHGGNFTAASPPGVGSRFVIRQPINNAYR